MLCTLEYFSKNKKKIENKKFMYFYAADVATHSIKAKFIHFNAFFFSRFSKANKFSNENFFSLDLNKYTNFMQIVLVLTENI